MLDIKIYITLKKTVADPQGLTIKHALESLGYQNLQEVHAGKLITLKLNTKDTKQAKQQLDEMCRKLLVNPIIEDYNLKIEEAK
jgi:phosphoribosylformylglycinamidine synthase